MKKFYDAPDYEIERFWIVNDTITTSGAGSLEDLNTDIDGIDDIIEKLVGLDEEGHALGEY